MKKSTSANYVKNSIAVVKARSRYRISAYLPQITYIYISVVISKEKIFIRVVEYVSAANEIIRGMFVASLRLPYLLKAIELLSLVFVKLSDNVREGAF